MFSWDWCHFRLNSSDAPNEKIFITLIMKQLIELAFKTYNEIRKKEKQWQVKFYYGRSLRCHFVGHEGIWCEVRNDKNWSQRKPYFLNLWKETKTSIFLLKRKSSFQMVSPPSMPWNVREAAGVIKRFKSNIFTFIPLLF